MSVEQQVRERYSEGAQKVVEALCCPVSYDSDLLKILPQEIIDRDYGCGDPSRYVKKGETVLDLGSGGGKICYMAAQLVENGGRVIGVDMNDDMLALARKYQKTIATTLGEARVTFHKGRIQDLALDLDQVANYLKTHPVTDLQSADAFENWKQQQRREQPMIPDKSIDLVISNCVLNLVADDQKRELVREIHRVVKPGGRVAISDIVSDERAPDHLKSNPELWSGCISGAFEESTFIQVFREAGFVGIAFDKWDETPWQVVEGIEFRSVTLTAIKSPVPRETERGHAVIYRGPLAVVEDERGNRFPAGQRIAVSEEVFQVLGEAPFAPQFIRLAPKKNLLPTPFTAPPGTRRPAAISRGGPTATAGCGPSGCC